MAGEETDKKQNKTKSEGSGPMGFGMFEMMQKFCTSEGVFSDCASMMRSKMGAKTGTPCCGPAKGKTKLERRKK